MKPTQLNREICAMVVPPQSYHAVPLPAHHHLPPEKAQAEAKSFLEKCQNGILSRIFLTLMLMKTL